MAIKIMTLNLNQYGGKHGPWPIRRDLVVQAIREQAADVVALQAVRKDPAVEQGRDQAAQLAARLEGYDYVTFVPTEPADEPQNGSAWLSRLPLADLDHVLLPLGEAPPDSKDHTPRLVLAARLQSHSIGLFNCHFSWVPSQTMSNVAAALPFIKAYTTRCLVMGDFNTASDSPALAPLRTDGLTDLWPHLHPDIPGDTFESPSPTQRIDYIWATADLVPATKSMELVMEQPNPYQARLSDHRGLILTLIP